MLLDVRSNLVGVCGGGRVGISSELVCLLVILWIVCDKILDCMTKYLHIDTLPLIESQYLFHHMIKLLQ